MQELRRRKLLNRMKLAPQAGFVLLRANPKRERANELETPEGANSRMRVGSSGWIRTSNPPVNRRKKKC